MSLLPKSIHRCRRYPTKFNSGRDIPVTGLEAHNLLASQPHSGKPGVAVRQSSRLGISPPHVKDLSRMARALGEESGGRAVF